VAGHGTGGTVTDPDGGAGGIRRAFAELAHGQVHYAYCEPPGRGPDVAVVLLLHQTPRSWAEFRDVLPLIGRHYRALAMDTVGFGDSVPAPWPPAIEGWAAVAAELLDALGVRRAHVVGHHTGGVVAVELAAAFPEVVASVVLSSTPYTDATFRKSRAERPPIDEVSISDDGSHLAALWRARQSFYPQGRPDLLEAFVADALKVRGDVEAGHRAVARYRMEDRIALVDQPVLVIRATADPFAAADAPRLCEMLPEARTVDIEGGMVPLPDQMPAEFAAAVLEFLDSDLVSGVSLGGDVVDDSMGTRAP